MECSSFFFGTTLKSSPVKVKLIKAESHAQTSLTDNENLKVGCTIVCVSNLNLKKIESRRKKCHFEGSTMGKRVKKSELLSPLLLKSSLIMRGKNLVRGKLTRTAKD
jgi:hypothetical protein